jgi:hypothetical protein
MALFSTLNVHVIEKLHKIKFLLAEGNGGKETFQQGIPKKLAAAGCLFNLLGAIRRYGTHFIDFIGNNKGK